MEDAAAPPHEQSDRERHDDDPYGHLGGLLDLLRKVLAKQHERQPRRTSVVPWPRPQLRPMKVAFLTASGSSAAMRVVTAARWSGRWRASAPKAG